MRQYLALFWMIMDDIRTVISLGYIPKYQQVLQKVFPKDTNIKCWSSNLIWLHHFTCSESSHIFNHFSQQIWRKIKVHRNSFLRVHTVIFFLKNTQKEFKCYHFPLAFKREKSPFPLGQLNCYWTILQILIYTLRLEGWNDG